MSDLENIKDLQKYNGLQIRLLTLLEIENQVIKLRVAVEEEMQQLKAPTESVEGKQ